MQQRRRPLLSPAQRRTAAITSGAAPTPPTTTTLLSSVLQGTSPSPTTSNTSNATTTRNHSSHPITPMLHRKRLFVSEDPCLTEASPDTLPVSSSWGQPPPALLRLLLCIPLLTMMIIVQAGVRLRQDGPLMTMTTEHHRSLLRQSTTAVALAQPWRIEEPEESYPLPLQNALFSSVSQEQHKPQHQYLPNGEPLDDDIHPSNHGDKDSALPHPAEERTVDRLPLWTAPKQGWWTTIVNTLWTVGWQRGIRPRGFVPP